jgi:hypothetical protein
VFITGVGFNPDPGATTIMFGGISGGVPPNVTPMSVTARVPPSPLPAPGTGFVTISGTSNGFPANSMNSEPVRYQYIIPGVPVLDYTNTGCLVGRLRATIYAADGTPVPGNVLLTGPSNSFVELTGAQTGSVTLASGDSIMMYGGGPVTAQNASNPSLSVTQSFVDARGNCFHAGSMQSRETLNPRYKECPGCTRDTVGWTLPSLGNPGYILYSGEDPSSMTADVVDSAATAVTLLEGGAVETLDFVGAPVSVHFKGAPLHAATAVSGQHMAKSSARAEAVKTPDSLQIAFAPPLSGRYPPSAYKLLHLVLNGKEASWAVVGSAKLAAHGRLLGATLQETGVYALARKR